MAKRIYLVHPERPDAISIRTGFSWPACLFGCLWAYVKRLWYVALALFVVEMAISVAGMADRTAGALVMILNLGFAVYCGLSGSDWHRRALERRGYVVVP